MPPQYNSSDEEEEGGDANDDGFPNMPDDDEAEEEAPSQPQFGNDDDEFAHDEDEGDGAPEAVYDSEDEKELTVGRDARDIANDRMDAKIFEKADKEAAERDELDKIDPEGLGDDFEASQWLPPSVKEAYRYKAHHMFKGGEGSILQTDVCTDANLSASACLYFLFVKECAKLMFWMTILSIPLLAMAYFGDRTPELDRDPMGLYQFTLGNVGYDRESPDFAMKSACNTTIPTNVNGTCIHVASIELAASDAANILSACEFLQGVLFLLFIHKIRKKTTKLMDDHEVGEVTVRDYSIMVTGLPPDITTTDLLIHFNKLYPLDCPDYRGRPSVKGAHKVKHIENSQQSLYMNSWIADISLHKNIGRFISAFNEQDVLMKELMKQRARMKMYGTNTPHAKGPKPGKYFKAEQEMMRLAQQLDQMADKVFHKDFKLNPEAEPTDLEVGEVHESKIIDRIQAEVSCAFVTFQYTESMARCVEDYAFYEIFPLKYLYQPAALKIHGQRVKVIHAPEPDELIWENIEVRWWDHEIRKSITVFIAFIAILISFAIIVQAAIYKDKFAANVPRLASCSTDIPNLYMQNDTISSEYSPWSIAGEASTVKLARPPIGNGVGERTVLDAECAAVTGSAKFFYGVQAENGDYTTPVGNYNTTACKMRNLDTDSYDDLTICPSITGHRSHWEGQFCPCFDMESQEKCHSIDCSLTDIDGSTTNINCVEFTASTMGSCYCFDYLLNLVKNTPAAELLSVIDSLNGHVCEDFLIAYSASSGLTYGTSVLVVIVNAVILAILKNLTKFEHHNNFAEERASYLSKVAVALYCSLCLVVLIAYGKIDEMPEFLKEWSIFQGPYDDFSAAWYSDVGLFLVFTFVIQASTPMTIEYLNYYVVYPLNRFIHFGALESQNSYKFACQAEVNAMICGPVFDPTEGQAQLLALFFCSMTFATGIPLLLFFTFFFFFLIFRANKILLMRFFQKPPHGGDGSMKVCLKFLPFAGLMRLGFAIWMLGNENVLEAQGLSASSLGSVSAGGVSISAGDDDGGVGTDFAGAAASGLLGEQKGIFGILIARSVRPNVVPLLVLMVLMIVGFLMEFFWKFLPVFWVIKVVKCILSVFKRSKKAKVHSELSSKKVSRKNAETGEEEEEIITESTVFLNPFEIHNLGHPLRQEQAPFTDDYISYCWDMVEEEHRMETIWCCRAASVDHGDFLTDDDRVQNWQIVQDGQYMVKIKPWNRTTTHNGVIRRKGDKKRTFEIMDETGASSYELDRVPRYSLTMKALEEAVILHETLAANPEEDDIIHDEHQDADGNTQLVPRLTVKPSVVNSYNHHKARLKVEKMGQEDWELDGNGGFDEEYKRVAMKKAKKTSFELNNTAADAYHSHNVEEEWSEGSGEEDEDDDEEGEDEEEEEEEEGEGEEEGEEEEAAAEEEY